MLLGVYCVLLLMESPCDAQTDARREITTAFLELRNARQSLNRLAFQDSDDQAVLKAVDDEFMPLVNRALSLTVMAIKNGQQASVSDLSAECAINAKGIAREVLGYRLLNSRGVTTSSMPSWVTLRQVRQALSEHPDSVLINIVKFKNTFANQDWYVAWLIPSDGSGVAVADLGIASGIEGRATGPATGIRRLNEEITSVQDLMKVTLKGLRRDATPDEVRMKLARALLGKRQECDHILRNLGAQLFGTLASDKRVIRAKDWILSPAADVWLVPFAAVRVRTPEKTAEYAIKRYQITYQVTPRSLVQVAAQVGGQRSVVIGDPAFGPSRRVMSRVTTSATALTIRRGSDDAIGPSTELYKVSCRRRPGRCEYLLPPPERTCIRSRIRKKAKEQTEYFGLLREEIGSFDRVTSVRILTKDIAKNLNVLADRLLVDARASEANIRAYSSPTTLAFCTHGFYLERVQKVLLVKC